MQIRRFSVLLKAVRQLGITQTGLNFLYRAGLISGYFRLGNRPAPALAGNITKIAPIPSKEELLQALGKQGLQKLLGEAEEILQGNFRQFGGDPVPIHLAPTTPLAHWADVERSKHSVDIKLTWEPARFGWAFCLGRAYHASADERCALGFWELFEKFNAANPVNMGPNWTSGQEVGIRLMAFVWAAHIFEGSQHSTPQRMAALTQAVASHAARIPGTLLYARSQNNNHLLTEAAALYTAGLALPWHPRAAQWQKTGKKWLSWCFNNQIDEHGEYVQHSSNYHRLMLQTALWVHAISRNRPNCPISEQECHHLQQSTAWLIAQMDDHNGRVPNLGANDGALIFPFSTADFSDYRPVAGAAACAFLAEAAPPTSEEMSLWFGLSPKQAQVGNPPTARGIIRTKHSWASLRAMRYTSRPSHADQLHCELWWQGYNIAGDAGTYRYNDAPPWDNTLTSTLVHNTISINAAEQMSRAGRFLYLDWAPAEYLPATPADGARQKISAQTSAYQKFGVLHTRSLTLATEECWQVLDELNLTHAARQGSAPVYRLHWLLPDWEWQFEREDTRLNMEILSPAGRVSLHISASEPLLRTAIIRAGEIIEGDGAYLPILGWRSPTYNYKKPALSLVVEVQSGQNVRFLSEFTLPIVE